jgi:hypothetical protein
MVIQVERMENGIRRIVGVAEVMPLEGGSTRIEEIYRYRLSSEPGVPGYFETTGHVPLLFDRLALHGVRFNPSDFAPRVLSSASQSGDES